MNNLQQKPVRKTAVVAVGGNALILDNSKTSIGDQYEAVKLTCRYLVDMVEADWNIVLTHGNGPQVGFILRRSELAKTQVPEIPLEYAGADTQGAIGHMFQKALSNELKKRGIQRESVALVTQVLVDKNDPAFASPTKPIGGYMDEDTAKRLEQQLGWQTVEDSGRGYRRVVASPKPQKILDRNAIDTLIGKDFLVVACGGGGVPVIRNDAGELLGIDAVIDKDLSSALLAEQLSADLLIISTAVEKVAINFNQPNQEWLSEVNVASLQQYMAEGQFPAGSMGPKIAAIIEFLQNNPNGRAIVTDPANLSRALRGETGTHMVP